MKIGAKRNNQSSIINTAGCRDMRDKKTLRREIKLLKDRLSEKDKSRQSDLIWKRLENTERFRQAETILMYWSMPDEVPTHDFILRRCSEKTIVLPVVDGDLLRLRQFSGEQKLKRNATLNLYEPLGDDYPDPQNIELAVIPGIAFDRNNQRLGRGKGYYDRLLPDINAYKIGVCFDFQLFDNIPVDKFDVQMDEVITG